ncbi:hypothetical protein Hanom_Chr07g00642971 [Helianthus anomalus]
MAKLEISDQGAEVTRPKNFYKTGRSKMCIPKNFYTKTTYSPLLSEKFGGSPAPSRPLKASPMSPRSPPLSSTAVCIVSNVSQSRRIVIKRDERESTVRLL